MIPSSFVPHCPNSQPETLTTAFLAASFIGYKSFLSIGLALKSNF